MKKIIAALLRKSGYKLEKLSASKFNDQNLLYVFAENLLHHIGNENFSVIQIGANLGLDGLLNDPIKDFFLKNKNVNGVLVEPMKEYLDVVKTVYHDNVGLNYENSAIGEKEGQMELMRFKPGIKYQKSFYDGLATMKTNRINELLYRAKIDKTEDFLQKISVPVVTPLYLLNKYNLKSVSLLQVDTEGYDYIIVHSFITNGIYPKVINFEYTELTSDELVECSKFLQGNGYTLIKHGSDILAIHSSANILAYNNV